jgi:hypothetical protein
MVCIEFPGAAITSWHLLPTTFKYIGNNTLTRSDQFSRTLQVIRNCRNNLVRG